MTHTNHQERNKPCPVLASPRWRVAGICIALAAITWIVFGQTLKHDFVNYDDSLYVYENPLVTGGLTRSAIFQAFTRTACNFWHPLTMLSHMADCQIFGLNPGGHHLTAVLLHAATAVLLFLVLREMTGGCLPRSSASSQTPTPQALRASDARSTIIHQLSDPTWPSAFVAALFAIHPLRVESVAWIAERKDVLSGVFFVLTLWAYVRYVRRPSVLRYLSVAVVFTLGLMAKPSLVTLPCLLLLLDYWPLNRFSSRGRMPIPPLRIVLEKAPLLALSIAACVAAVFAQGDAVMPLGTYSIATRIGNALVSGVTYIGQMFYPVGLAVFYPHPGNNLPLWKPALALLLLTTVSIAVLILHRRRSYLLLGWFWYLGMLVPMSGIVQVGGFAHADRFTYLPQIGLSIALVWLAADLTVDCRHRSFVLGAVGGAVLASLLLLARGQTAHWLNSESLWTQALAHTTNNSIAHNNLGYAYQQMGRFPEAAAHLDAALRIDPNHAKAHNNLGNVLLQTGQLDGAIAHQQKAIELDPLLAEASNDLGSALLQTGRVDEAIPQFERALGINPHLAKARTNLATALFRAGKPEEAIAQYRGALAIRPDLVDARAYLGTALLATGRPHEAIAEYRRALDLRPDYAETHNNLGVALLHTGQTDKAVAHLETALRISPNYADAHSNLGDVFLRTGRQSRAAEHYEKVLETDPQSLPVLNNLAWIRATSPDSEMRNGEKAVELAEKANTLAGGQNPAIGKTLAAAYAENGRFDEAIRIARKTIELSGTSAETALAAQMQEHLRLYETGQPLRESPGP